MAADRYTLRLTAGPNYTDQKPLPINTEQSTRITSSHLTADLTVRIQNFRAPPTSTSPPTSPYFSHPPHQHDLYSIQFAFTPKADLNGHDVVFGNDFDHPIRDKLPPGFQQAFNLVKWFIDPGLYADVHADEPYLYGPLLSSMNVWRVGPREDRAQEALEEKRANNDLQILEEGGDGDGVEWRKAAGVPAEAAARKKYFLNAQHLKDFTFEKGREYSNDFFNPYLDFNDFALRLPGFSLIPGVTIPIINYWDGQPLRYVMKNRATDEPLLVIVVTLVPKEGEGEEEKDDSENDKKKAEPAAAVGGDDDDLD